MERPNVFTGKLIRSQKLPDATRSWSRIQLTGAIFGILRKDADFDRSTSGFQLYVELISTLSWGGTTSRRISVMNSSASDFPACRLLVVDDEDAFRLLLGELLRMGGFEVVEADGGESALNFFASGATVDAMLLDYRMPRMDGAETLAALRRNGVDVPVVLVSAMANIHELATAHGFDGAISKPCSPEQVKEILKPILVHAQKRPDGE